eukprot:5598339-Amphidinium_carterae.1
MRTRASIGHNVLESQSATKATSTVYDQHKLICVLLCGGKGLALLDPSSNMLLEPIDSSMTAPTTTRIAKQNSKQVSKQRSPVTDSHSDATN